MVFRGSMVCDVVELNETEGEVRQAFCALIASLGLVRITDFATEWDLSRLLVRLGTKGNTHVDEKSKRVHAG